jgi:hypothetical protein
LWILTGIATALALIAFWGGVAVVGYTLVPVTVLSYIGFARLVPPRGGRRWLVLFERGFVEGTVLDGVRAVDWKDVQALEQTPGVPGGITMALRTEHDGEPRLVSFDPPAHRRMFQKFEVCLRRFVLEQARVALRDHGSVSFTPLTITMGGLKVSGTDRLLPWEQKARVIVDGDRLTVSTTSPSGLLVTWFEGQVPHAAACREIIHEVAAPTRQSAAMSLRSELLAVSRWPSSVADPLRKHLVGLAVLALVIPTAYAGYARLFLPVRQTEPPFEYLLDEACGDRRVAFTSAARYEGPGPHPVVAYDDVVHQPEVDSQFPQIPAEWRPQRPALTQLIVCVRMDVALTGRTPVTVCHAQELFSGFSSTLTFYRAEYQVDVYEARTGKMVGTTSLVAAEATCPHSWRASRQVGGSQIDVPARPSGQAYRDALRGYVE